MKNWYLFLVLFLLISCHTKTIDNSGGIVITLDIEDRDLSAKEHIDETIAIIQRRMESFCEENPMVYLGSSEKEIVIELPNQDKSRLPIFMKLLEIKGNVRILEAYNFHDMFPYLEEINNLLADEDVGKQESETRMFTPMEQKQLPLYKLLTLPAYQDISFQPELGYCHVSDTAELNSILNMKEAKSHLPKDAEFYWSRYSSNERFVLYAAKLPVDESYVPITTEMIETAKFSHKTIGGHLSVTFTLFENFHQYWSILTQKNIDKALIILVDDWVYSSPIVRREMTKGVAHISGNFTPLEGSILSAILNSGEIKNNLSIQKVDVIELK